MQIEVKDHDEEKYNEIIEIESERITSLLRNRYGYFKHVPSPYGSKNEFINYYRNEDERCLVQVTIDLKTEYDEYTLTIDGPRLLELDSLRNTVFKLSEN